MYLSEVRPSDMKEGKKEAQIPKGLFALEEIENSSNYSFKRFVFRDDKTSQRLVIEGSSLNLLIEKMPEPVEEFQLIADNGQVGFTKNFATEKEAKEAGEHLGGTWQYEIKSVQVLKKSVFDKKLEDEIIPF